MTTDPRRYGRTHQQLRAQLVAEYEAVRRGTPCAICHEPMYDHPRDLDLAHDDSGLGYRGLSHARCNRGDAARLGHDRAAERIDPQPRPSRTKW